MAPIATANLPAETPGLFSYDKPSKLIFPDGIKTSGQMPPRYELIRPYDSFPDEITGPTVWKAEEYAQRPEQWTHHLNAEEIEEMGKAADAFIGSGTPLTAISKDKFPLPAMSTFLTAMRHELLNGKGFILFKNFPVQAWGLHKSAVAYMGLGTHIGYFVSQNGLGHVLGHVKDTGDDPSQTDKVRIYRTTARQFFHADDCDVVGLLCVARALEGGESDIVSTHHVFNTLQRERPDVVKTLCEAIWHWDRKGEVSPGQEPYMRQPIFYQEAPAIPEGTIGQANPTSSRVYCKWDPYYIHSLSRFWDAGVIPRLTPAQEEAAQVLEETCQRLALHMILEVGDIQFLSNAHVLHSRTAYKDAAPPAPRRHLLRLWLATPQGEGGWRLPFEDAEHAKRGGVQVNDTAPRALLDAE